MPITNDTIMHGLYKNTIFISAESGLAKNDRAGFMLLSWIESRAGSHCGAAEQAVELDVNTFSEGHAEFAIWLDHTSGLAREMNHRSFEDSAEINALHTPRGASTDGYICHEGDRNSFELGSVWMSVTTSLWQLKRALPTRRPHHCSIGDIS